ncbi:MAG: Foldase protein PrsA 1 precursor [Firmicutes bacterium ADurb.Bin193]|nr:MAG: Foldase protein PrsA 1 precursor [Firmicutes bacterium ADurb.Bin193]
MKKYKGYIAGVLTGLLLASAPIFADSYTKTIEALVNFTNVKINGTSVKFDNFVVDGKTYVGLRDIATLFGKIVDWDPTTNTASILDKGTYIYTEDDKRVIATVDGAVITKGDVNTSILLQPDGNTRDEQVENALNAEIDAAVELNQAAKNGFPMPAETSPEAKAYVDKYRTQYGEQFALILASFNMNDTAYTNYIEKNMLIKKFRESLKKSKTFTDAELEAKYEEMADSLQTFTAKHILIRTGDRTDEEALEEILEIYEILTPDNFDEVMAEFSEDKASKDNPDGITFVRGQMIPEFEAACISQEVGTIGTPVKTEFGYHIIMVTDRFVWSFDQAKETITEKLFDTWYKEQIALWRSALDIKIDDTVVDSLKAQQ